MSLPPPSQYAIGQQGNTLRGYAQGYVNTGQWRPQQGYQPQNKGQQGIATPGYVIYPSMGTVVPQAHFVAGQQIVAPATELVHSTLAPLSMSGYPQSGSSSGYATYVGPASITSAPLQGLQAQSDQSFGTCGSVLGPPISQQGFQTQAFNVGTPSLQSQQWLFDSGATSHVTNDLSNLSFHQPYVGSQGLSVGNGATIPIAHSGQSNTSNSVQGSLPSGVVSTSELI